MKRIADVTTRRLALKRLSSTAAAVAVLCLSLAAVVASPANATDSATDSGTSAPAFTQTKTLTRVFDKADGRSVEMSSNTVTVRVDQTQNLRGRQRVRIQWSGAQPSGGRAVNPFGENGLAQEYPVVVMQCRGSDAPGARVKVSPETCWTVSVAQRSRIAVTEGDALWTRDRDATEAQRERYTTSGDALPDAATCPDADKPPFATHLTPFISAKGTVYQACNSSTMAPEAAVGAAFPAAEVAAFTRTDGTGEVQFEVRSEAENESLGCSATAECSLVVIPINGLSCAAPEGDKMSVADRLCRRTGQFAPGSSNFRGDGVDQAVGPALWWSPSNWQNRFTVPLTFGLPPDTCEVMDSRAPTAFYGSELLAQASLQWAPAYCLSKDRFKYQHNQMSDEAGWNLMENGGGAAAAVSGPHKVRGTDPVAYAPTAVTGFSIGYVIDKPDNAGEVTDLKLTPRLIAKLMTQSYLGSELGREHPGLGKNPIALMSDPEFKKLNPGLSTIDQEAGAALLNLSNSSDVISQLTEYLSTDAEAMAWIGGAPDPWGMVVNPAYRAISLPRSEWPLLDTYVPKTQNDCRNANPTVYFSQIAAPVVNMRRIAEALLDGWPNVQTKCDWDASAEVWKVGRTDRQGYGTRFMLGVVSLGDSARYGLRNAALQTRPNTYVAPTDASLAAAVKLSSRQGSGLVPYTTSQQTLRKAGNAYPGTMVVYTAARTRNLDKAEAAKVAQFIRISTSEGQVRGSGNGQLPEGFLPITSTGVTAKLHRSAQQAAEAIEAQKAAVSPTSPSSTPSGKPSTSPGTSGGSPSDIGPDSTGQGPDGVESPSTAPSVGAPSAAPNGSIVPGEVARTAAVRSATADTAMVVLLLIGVLASAVAGVARLLVRGAGR